MTCPNCGHDARIPCPVCGEPAEIIKWGTKASPAYRRYECGCGNKWSIGGKARGGKYADPMYQRKPAHAH